MSGATAAALNHGTSASTTAEREGGQSPQRPGGLVDHAVSSVHGPVPNGGYGATRSSSPSAWRSSAARSWPGGDDRERVEHRIGDQRGHLVPATLPGMAGERIADLAPAVVLEHGPIGGRRGVEADRPPGGGDLFLGRGHDHRSGDRDAPPAGRHRGQDDVGQVRPRVHRMHDQPIGHLAGQAGHAGADAGQVDRDLRVVDRSGVEERRHQRQPIVLAAKRRAGAGLPGLPRGVQDGDVLAHPCHRPVRPRHPEAPLDVRAHLRSEAEDEAAAGQVCQVPGGCATASGERAKATAIAVPSSIRSVCSAASDERQERVMARLGGPEARDAGRLGSPASSGTRASGVSKPSDASSRIQAASARNDSTRSS